MEYSNIPKEIWRIIYHYLHDLKPVHNELFRNYARHDIETLSKDNTSIIGNEIIYHKSIHKIYTNTPIFF